MTLKGYGQLDDAEVCGNRVTADREAVAIVVAMDDVTSYTFSMTPLSSLTFYTLWQPITFAPRGMLLFVTSSNAPCQLSAISFAKTFFRTQLGTKKEVAVADLACAELGADVSEGELFVSVQAVAGHIAKGVDVVEVGAYMARGRVWFLSDRHV